MTFKLDDPIPEGGDYVKLFLPSQWSNESGNLVKIPGFDLTSPGKLLKFDDLKSREEIPEDSDNGFTGLLSYQFLHKDLGTIYFGISEEDDLSIRRHNLLRILVGKRCDIPNITFFSFGGDTVNPYDLTILGILIPDPASEGEIGYASALTLRNEQWRMNAYKLSDHSFLGGIQSGTTDEEGQYLGFSTSISVPHADSTVIVTLETSCNGEWPELPF